MNIVAIIQARMGSTRLPGKVLAELGGQTMLARVLQRTAAAQRLNGVVVATSDLPADDAVAAECRRLGVSCFRGSAEDVLARYAAAARAFAAHIIVRITADCPLIDPAVVDEVVAAFLRHQPDYAANTLQRTWPRGLDTEIFSLAALDRADRDATADYQRIHVTPYFYQHPDQFHLLAVTGPHDHGKLRWTVDTPDDLKFVSAVYGHLRHAATFGWRDVLELLDCQPHLSDINRHVLQKQLAEG